MSEKPIKTDEIHTSLIQAVRTGDEKSIRQLLAAGAGVNELYEVEQYSDGSPFLATPLMLAAGSPEGSSVSTLKLLISLGADVHGRVSGQDALRYAGAGLPWLDGVGGDLSRLQFLLELGLSPGADPKSRAMFVAEVARTSDPKRVAFLLALGYPAVFPITPEELREQSESVRQGLDSTFAAVAEDFAEIGMPADVGLRNLARSMNISVRGPSESESPIHAASRAGSPDVIRLLVAAGADVNARAAMGTTPLMLASTAIAAACLLELGADPAAETSSGLDVFECVFGEDTPEIASVEAELIAEQLLSAGCPLVRRGRFGFSRLSRAAKNADIRQVEFLLAHGHPLDADEHGGTALHDCCWHFENPSDDQDRRRQAVIQCLVQAGVSVNARDECGCTPLHEAVAGDGVNPPAIEALLKCGADPNARDQSGRTPLHHLYDHEFEYLRAVPLLLNVGADPRVADESGRTVLDAARQCLTGQEPPWRVKQWAEKGGPPCGWKGVAQEGDDEYQAFALLEAACARLNKLDEE